MKPKFRIGDRVRTIEHVNLGYVIGLGEDMYPTREVFAVGDTLDTRFGNATPFYFGEELELVGCGIPAPVLRWREVVNDVYSDMFGFRFTIRIRDDAYIAWFGSWGIGNPYETLGDAQAACQAYWQQLWDKEMLISRDLPETGE
jgi:hypothetical protein